MPLAIADIGDGPGALLPGESATAVLGRGALQTIGFEAVAGAKWNLTATRAKKSAAEPELAVASPLGTAVVLGKLLRVSKGSASVRNLPIGVTGIWRLDVSTPGAGGGVVVSAAAKLPAKRTLKGQMVAPDVGEFARGEASFDVPSGTTIDVSVRLATKSAVPVTFRLLGPDGGEIGSADGAKGSALLRGAIAPSIGTYTVEVVGGAESFTASIRTKAPSRRKTLTIDDVEAPPVITGITPGSVSNGGTRTIYLGGFGYTSRQSVRLFAAGASPPVTAGVKIGVLSDGSGAASFDLADSPAGTYLATVMLPSGRILPVPGSVEVTNLPPGMALMRPYEGPNESPIDVRIEGGGFDPGVTVEFRRASDSALLPVTSTSRPDHRTILTRMLPPANTVGVFDLVMTDGNGTKTTAASAFDLLGTRGTARTLRTITGTTSSMLVWDAAADPLTGNVCVATLETVSSRTRAVFVLVNPATGTVIDTLLATQFSGSSQHLQPHVSFHTRDRTWGMTWIDRTTSQRGYLRVADAGNLHLLGRESVLATDVYVDAVEPMADEASGGWLAAWTRGGAAGSPGSVDVQRIGTDGVPDVAGRRVVHTDSEGLLFYPTGLQRADGRFILIWYGVTADRIDYAISRSVQQADGTNYLGATECVTSVEWSGLTFPIIVRNPEDDTALVGFTYVDGTVLHSACFPLTGASASRGTLRTLATEGQSDEGYLTQLVWNPTRHEFVAATISVARAVVLRRIDPAGTVHPAYALQRYEAEDGLVVSGTAADTLHLIRAFDGVANGTQDAVPNDHVLTLTPIR